MEMDFLIVLGLQAQDQGISSIRSFWNSSSWLLTVSFHSLQTAYVTPPDWLKLIFF